MPCIFLDEAQTQEGDAPGELILKMHFIATPFQGIIP